MLTNCIIEILAISNIPAFKFTADLPGTKYLQNSIFSQKWFLLIGFIAIVLLLAVYFAMSYLQRTREAENANPRFFEQADAKGLNEDERQVLLDIATRAQLGNEEIIFTNQNAFDRGASEAAKQIVIKEGEQGYLKLSREVAFLREKLGFQKHAASSIGSATGIKLSSRQLTVGKKVQVTRRKERDASNPKCKVVENNEFGVRIQFPGTIKSQAGETWRVYYQFGSSIWEFDSFAISCDGQYLFLSHNENIRYINRRRFLRVPLKRPAVIARLPFIRKAGKITDTIPEQSNELQTQNESLNPNNMLEFQQATLTELGGPGLRLETSFQAKVGDRVMVLFELPDHDADESSEQKTVTIQDIGEVRNTTKTDNGMSIAVELTGLTDSDVDWLVKATNAAAREKGVKNKDTLTDTQQKDTNVAPVAAQGTQDAGR